MVVDATQAAGRRGGWRAGSGRTARKFPGDPSAVTRLLKAAATAAALFAGGCGAAWAQGTAVETQPVSPDQAISQNTTAVPTGREQVKKPHCQIPKDLAQFNATLPNLTRTVAASNGIHIIALGSSSTAGSGASSQLASYPARLDAELDRRFPRKDFIVTNYGTGGQLAKDMLARIREDVLTQHPALVIWQTGVNDAIQDVGSALFQETLTTGIRELKRAGIDVILVDMQFYPRSERVAVYGDYLKAMRIAAEEQNVPLFRRFAIMKHLVKSAQYTSDQLLAPDNFHLNDLSYGCLADLLADAIEEQVKAGIRTAGPPSLMR